MFFFREGALAELEKKPDQLSDVTTKYWAEILYSRYRFDSLPKIISKLKSITLNDFIGFTQGFLLSQENAKSVIVQLVGFQSEVPPMMAPGTLDGENATEIRLFQKSLELYSTYSPDIDQIKVYPLQPQICQSVHPPHHEPQPEPAPHVPPKPQFNTTTSYETVGIGTALGILLGFFLGLISSYLLQKKCQASNADNDQTEAAEPFINLNGKVDHSDTD